MQIKHVSTGIANRYDDVIEINEELQKYPRLYQQILRHELKHTDKKGFTKKDLMVDLTEDNIDQKELIKFMIKNPKSLTQILPVYIKEKTLFYDLNMLLVWGVMISLISGVVYLIA